MMSPNLTLRRLVLASGSRSKNLNSKQQYWQKQIELWRRSGLKKAAFCRENNLSRWTFHYWNKRLKSDAEEAVSFVKLPAIAIASVRAAAISVKLGDYYSVEVKSDFEAATLSRLLDVLEKRSRSC
jgi:hypothetical protein